MSITHDEHDNMVAARAERQDALRQHVISSIRRADDARFEEEGIPGHSLEDATTPVKVNVLNEEAMVALAADAEVKEAAAEEAAADEETKDDEEVVKKEVPVKKAVASKK